MQLRMGVNKMKSLETVKNEFRVYETARYVNALMKTDLSEYIFYVHDKAAKLQKKLIDEMGMTEFMAWLQNEVYAPMGMVEFMGGK